MANKRAPVYCSFCGKSQDQARRLIGGPHGVFICDECVALCNRILEDERNARTLPPNDAPQGSRHP